MAKIYVDHLVITKTANKINTYLDLHNKRIREINNIVDQMKWRGSDYNQAKSEWVAMKAKGSTSDKLLTSFENYKNALLIAANKYKEAQARAIDRAERLCK